MIFTPDGLPIHSSNGALMVEAHQHNADMSAMYSKIELAEAQNAKLAGALEEIRGITEHPHCSTWDGGDVDHLHGIASEALQQLKENDND